MNIIDKAKVIKIVEHSNKRDEVDKIDEYKEKIYKEVEIQPGQFEVVKKAFPISLDYTGIIEFGCLYDTHHRIEIIQKDGNAATIEICFICGEMCVNQGKINQMPIGWKNSLKVLMGMFGMHTDEYSFRKLKHKNSEPSAATNVLLSWLNLDPGSESCLDTSVNMDIILYR